MSFNKGEYYTNGKTFQSKGNKEMLNVIAKNAFNSTRNNKTKNKNFVSPDFKPLSKKEGGEQGEVMELTNEEIEQYKKDGYEVEEFQDSGLVSKLGYRNDSPDKNEDSLIINSSNISMKNVDHPVVGIDNLGNKKYMLPGKDYKFKGNRVQEFPVKQSLQKGGPVGDTTQQKNRLADHYYNRWNPKDSMVQGKPINKNLTKRITSEDPSFKDYWNAPDTNATEVFIGANSYNSNAVKDFYKETSPDEIWVSEDKTNNTYLPVFNKKPEFKDKPVDNSIPDLKPEINNVPNSRPGTINTSRPNFNIEKYVNPFTGESEGMSMSQHDKLQKEAFKLKNRGVTKLDLSMSPDIGAPKYIDATSRNQLNPNIEEDNKRIQEIRMQNDPEFRNRIANNSKAFASMSNNKFQSGGESRGDLIEDVYKGDTILYNKNDLHNAIKRMSNTSVAIDNRPNEQISNMNQIYENYRNPIRRLLIEFDKISYPQNNTEKSETANLKQRGQVMELTDKEIQELRKGGNIVIEY